MSDAVNELLQHIQNTLGLSRKLKRLKKFHDDNPDVLDFIVQELYDVREVGWKGASVISLWEYSRWVLRKTKTAGDPFAMNNNHRSYYARIIAILHPELNGFFEMREPGNPDQQERSIDAEMGTKLERVKSRAEDYGRRLLWADGTPIELGWQPTTPHKPKPVSRRQRTLRKSPTSVGLESAKVTA
jgi:hypothetical protein